MPVSRVDPEKMISWFLASDPDVPRTDLEPKVNWQSETKSMLPICYTVSKGRTP